MPQDSRHSGKTGVQELVEGGSAARSGSVNERTVFVGPGVAAELAGSVRLDTEFYDSWLLLDNTTARAVEQALMSTGRSFSAGIAVEASAFGCDSKVLDRAIGRLLENAAARSLDSVEITELRQHQDSGLDYVTILALGRTLVREVPSEPVDRSVGPAALQLEG